MTEKGQNVVLLALKMGRGATGQGMQVAPRSWKQEEMILPWGLSEGIQPCQCLILASETHVGHPTYRITK